MVNHSLYQSPFLLLRFSPLTLDDDEDTDSDDQSNSSIDDVPVDSWLADMFGPPPLDTAPLVQLQQRYPSLINCSTFSDIILVSKKYLKANAIRLASDDAVIHFATHPRIDLKQVASDLAQAQAMGLLPFLQARSSALAGVTLQPSPPLPPDQFPDMVSLPPRPPDYSLENYHQLCKGGAIEIPPGFEPDGCPEPAMKPADYALAIERLQGDDYKNGLSIVLPLLAAQQLFLAAGLPLNATPTSIVRKTDTPKGRLVVDVTRSRLNHPDKKVLLQGKYGPIVYPNHTDWCRLFFTVRQLFPVSNWSCLLLTLTDGTNAFY
jgi:hypothetical protein